MRLAQSSVAYGGADRSWLVSALEGQDNNLPVTLDLSLFPTGSGTGHFGSGGLNASEVIVKSGCALGIVTATGYAGPYDDTASDGRQTCVGLLLNDVEGVASTALQYQTDAAVRMGAIFTDRLPYQSGIGSLDANGKVDLKLVDFRVRDDLMRAVYDLVDLRITNLAARTIPYSDQTLEDIFPTVAVEDVEYRLVQENLVEQIVPARGFDTPAPVIARPGAIEIRGGVPAFSAADLLTETDSIRQRRLLGLNPDLQPTVNTSAARTTRTVLNSVEVLRGQVLSTGKVTLNANGVIQTADFNVPSANKVTAGTAWTNTAAPMVTDLDTWRTAYVNANGGPPARILTSTQAKRLMLRNTSIINAVAGAQTGRTMARPDEINAFLAAEDLPPIETYDRQYGSFANGFTRVLPANILVMLPQGALGSTQLGITEEAIELVNQQILAAAEAPGIAVITMMEDDPVQRAVKSAAIGMPVLETPYQLLIATLW